MKKITALFVLIAIAGLVSINAFAHTYDHYGFGGFNHFGYGMEFNTFGGFGHGMNHVGFASFNPGMDFGGFGYGMDFGGFGHGFAGFDGFENGFTARAAVPNSVRKIVPIPATASATNSSITYDENGEIHVRPFDDEDLFFEDLNPSV
jgi:hypothetical protein